MESTIWFTDGFVVITGEIGSGKTTLIETFLRELEQDVVVAQINQTQITPVEFLQAILVQFGYSPFKMRKAELLATINEFLVEQYAKGRKVLLIVDEGAEPEPEGARGTAPAVRRGDHQAEGAAHHPRRPARAVDKLDSPELIQLMQRVRLRFHLTALSESDTTEYIRHRLRVAGAGDRDLFEPETFPVIYRYTGGIPRLVNTLCDTAMLVAFAKDRHTVSTEELRASIDELQWVEYASRTHTQLRAAIEDTSPQVQLKPGRLVLSFKGKTVAECPIGMGRCIIGRTSDNDLQIDSTYISRHHAQVVCTADGVWIEDLNSTNGIFLGRPAHPPQAARDGDVVKLGLHEITYHLDVHDMVSTGNLDDPRNEESVEAADDEDEDESESAAAREGRGA